MAAIPPEQVVTLVLSIFCGVLGVFLLTHKGVRMMKGGLLYRISVGLAAIGALWRYKSGMIPVILGCGASGLIYRLITA